MEKFDHSDIDKIELSKSEISALDRLMVVGAVSDDILYQPPYDYLYRLKLVEHGYSDQFPYDGPREVTIPCNAILPTDKGRLVLAFHRAKRRVERKNTIQFLLPLIVSIAALVVSILK